MLYECEFCGRETDSAHAVALDGEDGGGDDGRGFICDECYEEWLHLLKG